MVKDKSKKDNKRMLVILLSVVLFIIAIAFLLVFLVKKDIDVISTDNSTSIDLSNEISYLKECLTSGGNNCPKVRQEEIDKFTMLDGSKGTEVCNSFEKIDNGNTYQKCFSFIRGCSQLFQFIDDGSSKDKKFYQVYQCETGNYYIYSHIMPPEIKVLKVELAENVITGLAVLIE